MPHHVNLCLVQNVMQAPVAILIVISKNTEQSADQGEMNVILRNTVRGKIHTAQETISSKISPRVWVTNRTVSQETAKLGTSSARNTLEPVSC